MRIFNIVVGLSCLVFSCKTAVKSSQAKDGGGQAQNEITSSFRNLFYAVGKIQNPNFSKEDLDEAIFLPTPEFLADAKAIDNVGSESWTRLKTYEPTAFYRAGKVASPQPLVNPRNFHDDQPITMVFIPGLFGEIIAKAPISEVLDGEFREKSAFYKKYSSRFKTATDRHFLISNVSEYDASVSIHSDKYQKTNVPIDDLVRYGSIDDENGRAVVNAIYFDSKAGSMETFGSAKDSAQVFARRLELILNQLDAVDKRSVFLVGYSRGTPVGLEMLVQAAESNKEWLGHIKGFISFCGVVFGSEMADDMFGNPNSANGKLKAAVDRFFAGIRLDTEGETLAGKADRLISYNTKRIQLIKEVMQIKPDPLPEDEIRKEKLNRGVGNFSQIFDMASQILNGVQGWSIMSYRKDNDYFFRMKLAYDLFIQSIDSLRTETRLTWWKTRGAGLPREPFGYYAIAGSMPEPTRNGKVSEIFNLRGYGHDTRDFAVSLRGGYYGLASLAKTSFSDGQVTLLKERFWPNIQSLNQPSNAQFLGVIGTHHWGLAWKGALDTGIVDFANKPNLYPRKVLLESLASWAHLHSTKVIDSTGQINDPIENLF